MAELFTLEFYLFLGGLAFVFMAGAAWGLGSRRDLQLPWPWLALFGLSHGLSLWLDMLALSQPDSLGLRAFRLALVAASSSALVEFGRRAISPGGRHGVGRWVFLPALGLVAISAVSGSLTGLEAACRYALGFPGGLLAGLALWRASRSAARGKAAGLRAAGLALAVYGAAAGLVLPKASFFPASWLNQDAFDAALGASVQLVEAACSLAAMAGIWAALGKGTVPFSSDENGDSPPLISSPVLSRWLWPAAFVLLAAGGWATTYRHASCADGELYGDLLVKVEATAGGTATHPRADPESESEWSKMTARRLRVGLPVVLGLFLALGCLIAVFGER